MSKTKIEEALKSRNISKMQGALRSGISPADFYQALNGKKPFFPKWRREIAETLNYSESELFPEYITKI